MLLRPLLIKIKSLCVLIELSHVHVQTHTHTYFLICYTLTPIDNILSNMYKFYKIHRQIKSLYHINYLCIF
jgi:benzoyl-CoA reductase/2-hydroxyglutaryl-CoA dehydratase subunit BcrC/BadD/HgdB